MATDKIKINARVKRAKSGGCYGVVRDVRAEISKAQTESQKEKSLMINVLWDNGTSSYCSTDALEVID